MEYFFEDELFSEQDSDRNYSKYTVRPVTDVDLIMIDIAKFQTTTNERN